MFSLKDHIKAVFIAVHFYDSLKLALVRHNEGKHSEAIRIYSELSEKGCQLAYLNLGNCYLFGVGVEKDIDKGFEMYGRCGAINDDDLKWMRRLSNDRYMNVNTLNLGMSLPFIFVFFYFIVITFLHEKQYW